MRINASSKEAKIANDLAEQLQSYFVQNLDGIAKEFGNAQNCEAVEWFRDEGRHGGGVRFEARDEKIFNRGSVNVSQVHYDDDQSKKLSSATAISCIIHPRNPHAPSMHMHFSWTQMRDGKGYWRLMADLNPSLLPSTNDKEIFDDMLAKAAGKEYLEEGLAQGNRYFNIPVLKCTRGVSHFYLENFNTGSFERDKSYVEQFAKKVIDAYTHIITNALKNNPSYTKEKKQIQIDYHTLYLLQVLTLDRGTTSGLLVHSQNDIGIMGSIPSHVNRDLLTSWINKMPEPQHELLEALLTALPKENPTPVEDETKTKLANVVRVHYKKYPEALSMQASGETVPPTVDNHK
ncbi:MAG: Coproporphyrinogen III oxidase, aerobic (EC [uncultured Sulfurovum sp.]|uniref:coproporphyrinogen oxidase n=1 Tax=uncultured Sulfurovum sp. TaxID=269237 RepID=A0A6S6UDW8_9BACT|nr:MAG: Coproporphyrinogen III oxidase, aerobic (EC [uncultured Sulfurovum sp.]